METSPSPSGFQEFKVNAVVELSESNQSFKKLDPAQKVITELYIALLPSIVISWTDSAPTKKTKYSTVASDLNINEIEPAYEVNIKFKNGNSFTGSTKDKRLHGEGVYRWSDGTVYEGSFNENKLEGECKIFYSSGKRYFGQASYGFHHGNGLFISKKMSYRGDFDSGMFHGQGSLRTSRGSFEGIFKNNKIDEGTRVYTDGIFSGKFNLYGERSKGRFLLSNGDIYNGKWQQDHYSEFGTYCWSPGYNCIESQNKFIIPKKSYFAGYWANSDRFGPGVLCFDERIILTTWKFDKKFGPGVIIAANGETFVSEKMYLDGIYREGFIVTNEETSDKHIQNLKAIVKEATRATLMENRLCKDLFGSRNLIKPMEFEASILNKIKNLMQFATKFDVPPIFLPKNMINLKRTPIVNFVAKYLPDVERETLEMIEIKSLSQVISFKLGHLEQMYLKYAGYGKDGYFDKRPFMLRLGLWRFLRTIHYFDKKFNSAIFLEEVEYSFHLISENLNDPYEIIYFWQFLKYILCVTMYLNRNHSVAQKTIQKRPPFFGLFATMLIVFLRDHEKTEAIAIDNFPIFLSKEIILMEFIFGFIKEYQPQCPLRMTYKLFTSILEKLNAVQEGNLLQFDDFIQCVSMVYPGSVLDDSLIHLDSPLTPIELFEIFILIILRSIRNKKYMLEKNKFIEKFNENQRKLEEEAETERLRQELGKSPEDEDKKKKKKKKKTKSKK